MHMLVHFMGDHESLHKLAPLENFHYTVASTYDQYPRLFSIDMKKIGSLRPHAFFLEINPLAHPMASLF